jgi:hypothetical protein
MTPSREQHLQEHAERNLGSIVVTIEFTLVSVVAGVILFPLMDNAAPILRDLKFEYVPYIISGVILILYLWTEVITHSLSFVGWPMDLVHNLLYIIIGLVFGIQMHLLEDPQGWFAVTVLSAILASATVYYDLRIIQDRMKNAAGEASAKLYEAALTRQRALLRTAPFTVGNAIVQIALIYLFPVIFIEYKAHLILIVIQIAAFIFLIWRTITAFNAERGQILQKAIEELASEE